MSFKSQSNSHDHDPVSAGVVINRPVAEVYEFYRDFRNIPRFLGDVMAVKVTGPRTSEWTIQGPLGFKIQWVVRITEERKDAAIHYETSAQPALRARWQISFRAGSDPNQTEIREVMKVPLGSPGRAVLALIGKNPAEEVSANLTRLKQLVETGHVTETAHSVPGKFDTRDA